MFKTSHLTHRDAPFHDQPFDFVRVRIITGQVPIDAMYDTFCTPDLEWIKKQ
ncbi:uncharacterized protein CPUR_08088 [Claviceps purpurea 20.1]|uniref:Uncharacterized protein n=1 Tax=Claviceps purpurea (strain 20.1) TaxID=1111077 RepID=M1W5L1_CLAP2|nr:uncharacterized protein CPUR_08088 [Claviceps purpurea 20.1]